MIKTGLTGAVASEIESGGIGIVIEEETEGMKREGTTKEGTKRDGTTAEGGTTGNYTKF